MVMVSLNLYLIRYSSYILPCLWIPYCSFICSIGFYLDHWKWNNNLYTACPTQPRSLTGSSTRWQQQGKEEGENI